LLQLSKKVPSGQRATWEVAITLGRGETFELSKGECAIEITNTGLSLPPGAANTRELGGPAKRRRLA
jgi:hypothetical protein